MKGALKDAEAREYRKCPECGLPTVPDYLRNRDVCMCCYVPQLGEMPPEISWSQMQILVMAAVAIEGSQKAAAMRMGISTQYLNDVIRGRREISDRIAGFFGLERVVVYRQKESPC